MNKETKIGLAVVGALLVMFTSVLAWKLTREKPGTTGNKAMAKAVEKPKGDAEGAAASLGEASARWLQAKGGDESESTAEDAPRAGRSDPFAARSKPVEVVAEPATDDDTAEPATVEPATAEPAADAETTAAAETTPDAETTAGAGPSAAETAAAEPLAEPTPEQSDEATTPVAEARQRRGQPRAAQPLASGPAGAPRTSPDADPATEPAEMDVRGAARDAAIGDDDQSAAAETADEPVDQPSQVVPAAAAETSPARGSVFGSRRGAPAQLEPAEPDGATAEETASAGEARASLPRRARVEPSGQYTVEPNDTFWTISERVYGSGGYFKALREFNREKFDDPDRLQVGEVVQTPLASELEKRFPQLCPKPRRLPAVRRGVAQASADRPLGGRTYKVAEGDTLFDIARFELGKASRWAEIYELNKQTLGDDFDYLKPGTELALPPRGAGDALTRRRGGTVER